MTIRANIFAAMLFVVGVIFFYLELKSAAAKTDRVSTATSAVAKMSEDRYRAERPNLEIELGPLTMQKLDANLRNVKRAERAAKE